ncbi:MAG: Exonuclease RecJ [Candidatus Roizmanbacteria bacterium GW2011_GWA2_37_7]|uniref:Single-stranded-DNA-specific exonuclease RecJ n=1 Tax=Candidatus Roizmanbacteria bacterium GW2011_GWA2_37_7 TaxID=1618481 RepID=A0A0G0KD17_9BACT|nr:MAG: Exonuclease RecJ [Candidatus Roizmanbacteria bacterium GW2011_GWA2_37_7]
MKITYKHKITEKLKPQEIVDLLLKSRGIKDTKSFLNPASPLDLSLKDFGFKKRDIAKMIKLLQKIKKNNEMIVVYTDYDADGITGGTILWETLYVLGFKVMPYVPHRQKEGYGFSEKGIDTVKNKYDPKLIISVDHGITAIKEVAYAKKLGINVIVTDHHHRQKEKVPGQAVAIFHIPALSGSGTAYMVAKEMYQNFIPLADRSNLKELERNFHTDYLALASIGTIADLVPLTGPSRSIVSHGLQSFQKVKRPGIKHILKEAQIADREIGPYEIGFIIAPRINAVGRLEHAIDALRLLCTKDDTRAHELACKVGDMNTSRQDLVKEQLAEAQKKVEKLKEIPKLIILYSNHWHEGVIGLIAGKILEKYYRPTIVMTKGDGFYKASVRSIHGFHITDFLKTLDKYLTNYGGHAAAAGFTLISGKRDTFIKVAQKKADILIDNTMLEQVIEADIKIPIAMATKSLVEKIEKLQPFGMGNPKPTFVSEVVVMHAKTMGKSNDHLKLQVNDPLARSTPVDMVSFGQGEVFKKLTKNQKIQVVYQLNLNRWNGHETVQGIVKHLEL